MLETIISTTGDTITLPNTLMVIVSSIILGVIISLSYIKTNKNTGFTGLPTTLVMLPVIIAIIIFLVGNNVARAFSLSGAFAIIRFRSAPGGPKDISYIFFTLAVGLACGMGYIVYGVLFTIVLCALMLVLDKINFAAPNGKVMRLKITIPEDLNYDGVFDEVLDLYTNDYAIERIRTRDFGALFELNYKITLKGEVSQKQFLDEIRCKNGNLNISLTLASVEDNVYA